MIPQRAGALVVFGVTGDLARRMVIPALYQLVATGQLDVPIIGVALADYGDDGLRRHAREVVQAALGQVDEQAFARFAGQLSLVAGDYADRSTFERLRERVKETQFLAHYAAVPPSLFVTVAAGVAGVGLHEHARLAVEKPFGRDLASARALNDELHRFFPEERLLRVDHFLGKEPVEDIAVLRFANTLLESVWNRSYVNNVQITFAETLDVADRGSFYDEVGAVRDVVQNHLLQVLAYLTMEPPVSDDAEAVRDEKVRLLRSTRAIDPEYVVRGSYEGYLDVHGVRGGSRTETFVAFPLRIDNHRWAEVPFLIRTGKCLPVSSLEAVLELRRPPRMLFAGLAIPPPNLIRLRLGKEAGVTLSLLAKRHGSADTPQSIAFGTDFEAALGPEDPPYVRILADLVAGDRRHFARQDAVEEAWRIVDPILDLPDPPPTYARGTWGPPAAKGLAPGGAWHPLSGTGSG